MTAGVVSRLMNGIPIDATIALQPQGAAQIVDALGGLNVAVDEDMDYDDNYGELHIHLGAKSTTWTGSQVKYQYIHGTTPSILVLDGDRLCSKCCA